MPQILTCLTTAAISENYLMQKSTCLAGLLKRVNHNARGQ